MSRWMHGFGTAFGICGMPLVLAYVSSCDDAPPIAPTSGDATADAARPSRRDAGSSEDDAFVPPTPSSVPEGWVRYDDYDPACGLYIPSDKKYLPEPVRWEPCTNPVGDAGTPDPQSMVCRRMVTDWPVGSSTGQHTTTWLPTAKTDDGRLLVLLRRLVGDQLYDMVADVDGPVRNALLRAGQCLAIKPVLSKTHILYRIVDTPDEPGPSIGGTFGGPIDELHPSRVYLPKGYQPSTFFSYSLAAGPRLFIENYGGQRVYSLQTGELLTTLLAAPGDESSLYAQHQFVGDTAFFIADARERTIVKVWTQAGGIKTLVGDPYDYTRSSAGFHTDGVDMVWIEASGRTDPNAKLYSKLEIWTAPYSEDPDVVAHTKRRLRTHDVAAYGYPFVVGCGYAAIRSIPTSDWGQFGMRIVRLSDGMSWQILNRNAEQTAEWRISHPYAITCDEVFALAGSRSHIDLVRVRLDSLGPATPPD